MKRYQEETLKYYEQNNDSFIAGTINSDMTLLYEKFESLLADGAYILDLGCGSGRDTKHFLERGYRVEAIDGSQALCDSASAYIGQEVKCMLFEDIDYVAQFDAVWACASLLHVSKEEMSAIIKKIYQSLKQGGVFFTCFKYGDYEYIKDGRFFNNYDKESVKQVIGPETGFEIIDIFVSGDVREDKKDERWVNVIARSLKDVY